MSGRETILKKIRSDAMGLMFLGLTLTIVPVIVVICMLLTGNVEGNITLVIILTVCAAFGGFLMAYNMRVMLDPITSLYIKRNPDILEQADELLSNVIYRDDFIIFSDRLIASAVDIRQISYMDELFLVYVYIHKTNGVTDQKKLKLETARRTIAINIYAKKDEEVNALIDNIVMHCRYAKVGYNSDSMAYLKQMRELWKNDQEEKQKRKEK